jgi:hypothetical protein
MRLTPLQNVKSGMGHKHDAGWLSQNGICIFLWSNVVPAIPSLEGRKGSRAPIDNTWYNDDVVCASVSAGYAYASYVVADTVWSGYMLSNTWSAIERF